MLVIKKLVRHCSTEKVKSAIFDLLSRHPKVNYLHLAPQSAFKDLGLNSLDTIEFLVEIEEDLKVDLLDDELIQINTCEDAIKIFTAHYNRKFS